MSNPPNTPKKMLANTDQLGALVLQGSTLHQQGDLIKAQEVYKQILSIQSDNFDVLQLFGILSAQTKNYLKAVELFSKALKINPNHAGIFNNLGIALKELSRIDEALTSFDRAIAINPDSADSYNNRGNILQALSRPEEALTSFDRAIAINSDFTSAYFNRGNTFNTLKQFDKALSSFDQAIATNPRFGIAYKNRGDTLMELDRFDEALASFDQAILAGKGYADLFSNRGVALKNLNRPNEALDSYDQAIANDPNYATAYYNRGNILQTLKRPDEAIVSYDQAIANDPNYATAYYNRGGVFNDLKCFDEAIASYDQAIAVDGGYADAFSNRGTVLRELKRIDEAIGSYNQAIAIDPHHIESHWNSANCNLMKGNFDLGWQFYEWRWLDGSFESKPLKTNKPAWNYQKINKRLLIWEEQGIGDQILFGSLLCELLDIMPDLLVKIDKRLIPIFKRSFPKIKFYPHDADVPESDYDIHLPIGSLGKCFRNSNTDFLKTKNNFLISDETKTQKIRQELSASKKLLCGVSWRSKNVKTGAARSLPLDKLASIFDPEKICLVNLQYGDITDDLNVLKSKSNIEFIQYKSVDNFNDLDSFASLIDACDLVVSIDNSTIHISAALGKKSLLLLPYVASWQWLLEGQESLWYPSLKLYRQKEINSWDNLLKELKIDLKNETVEFLTKAIEINPNQAGTYNNLGMALKEINRLDESLTRFDQAIKIDPDYTEAYFNRGSVLRELKRFEEALVSYNESIKTNPNNAGPYYNRGAIFIELKRFEEAIACYDQAIASSSDYLGAHLNRGYALQKLNRIDEAKLSYRRAIEINPDHIDAHYNLSLCDLMCGNFEDGWKGYEWRWSTKDFNSVPIKTTKPAWNYQKTEDRLLVWAEQGIGDHIFFGTLLSELIENAPNILVQVDRRLIPIFTRSFPNIKFYSDEIAIDESDYDIHVPIGSLGIHLRNNKEDFFKSKNTILISDSRRTQIIRQELSASRKLICGISWKSTNPITGPDRSLPLQKLASIFDPEKICLVNLQYGDITDDLNVLKSKSNIEFIQYEPVDNFNDLDGFASLIDACDFVVSIDNSTIHISAALGKKSFVLLPFAAEWRWLIGHHDSHWYQYLKTYRQEKRDYWDDVLEKLKAELLMFIT